MADFDFDDEDDKGKRDDRRKPDKRAEEGEKPAPRSAPRANDEDDDRPRRSSRRRDEDDDRDRDRDDDYDRPSRRRGPAGPSAGDYFTFAATLPPLVVMIIFWIGFAAFLGYGIYLISEKATMLGLSLAIVGACFWRLLCDRVVLATKTVEKLDEIAKALAGQAPAAKKD